MLNVDPGESGHREMIEKITIETHPGIERRVGLNYVKWREWWGCYKLGRIGKFGNNREMNGRNSLRRAFTQSKWSAIPLPCSV